jgi:DNA (cytosine-5)-methyltransferase 1
MARPTFLEFFAGGGMARAGFGPRWRCLFANDIDARKGASYVANWGADDFRLGDIHRLRAEDIPGHADLAWASFPCQDLSLAGNGAGLGGARSGAFYGFRDVIASLEARGRAPSVLVLENVLGALTANGGADFVALCESLRALGYDSGAVTIDAARFTPQSRPRLFVIATRRGSPMPARVVKDAPDPAFATPSLRRAVGAMPAALRGAWRWWALPPAPATNARLDDLIEEAPNDVDWHAPEETERLLSLMAPGHLAAVENMRRSGERRVGAIYRRTRVEAGRKVQRAEARFDGLAGCLRTPGGGSSRQFIIVIEGARTRTRLLSGREAARLMGLPDDYRLPVRYGDAYHLLGDGVVAPVVRHLATHLLAPLVAHARESLARADGA